MTMNIRVTIELDGTSSEIESWLSRFGISEGQVRSTSVSRPALGRGDEYWDPIRAEQLVRRITPLARTALWHMSNNAPSLSFEDLQENMDVNGVQLGGVLASFGFAENAGFPRPYRVDKKHRRYLVDPELAPMFIDAIRDFEDS